MSQEQQQNAHRERDAELEREIRKERKFSLSEAIGRLAGPGCMKGASPVSRARQAAAEIEDYLRIHLTDSAGGLRPVLLRNVRESELLLNNLDQPLLVLAAYIQRVLGSEFLLKDFVREADVEWGQLLSERPLFEKEGAEPQPDDPYTLESVCRVLSRLVELLAGESALQ
jgi:hypothetical protein